MSTLYDIINILPLSLLTVILFGGYAGVPEGNIFAYLFCAALTLWIVLLPHMKRKNRLRSIGIVSVFTAALILAVGEELRKIFIREYLWVIWIAAFCVLSLLTGILMKKNIWVKRAVAAGLLGICVTWTILDRKICKEAFVLLCFILLVRAAEEIQRRWKKSGDPDERGHITRISPIFLALCLIVYLIPAPDDPYDWKLARDMFDGTVSLFNRVYGFFAHSSDDYGTIGFSDKGGFLSGLVGSDEEVLHITTDSTSMSGLRLIGCISGDFGNMEWIFDTETETEGTSRTLDTMETLCAVRKYDAAFQSDFCRKMSLNYKTLFYNTKYIFAPAKIRLEATKEKTPRISERGGSIVSNGRLNYEDSYYVSCYVFNYDNPDLAGLLESAAPVDETDWLVTQRAENVEGSEGYSYEDYLRYREDIYTNYCRSHDLSERAREILDRISESSETRFEAVKKLETYLKSMEYSTDCGPLPDTVTDAAEFIDHFLFTSRKGYCMHFATAFVLMANEMGIPCRYVQGFDVSAGPGSDIVVRNSDAHAWPEVYFDNVGWVAFDPTPGYSSYGWQTSKGSTYVVGKNYYDFQIDDKPDEKTDAASEDGQEHTAVDPLIFVIPSLAVVSFLLMFYFISRSVAKNRYARMSVRDKFRYLTQQDMRFLGYLGFRMEEGETLSEFSRRIAASDMDDVKDKLGFIPIYEDMLYSDRELTEDDIKTAESIYRGLRAVVKNSRLRFRLLLMLKKQ